MRERFGRFLLGDGGGRELPARVLADVRAQQDRSEILVGAVQLAFVVLLGSFYLLAPMAAGQVQADADYIPAILAVYAGLTLARIAFALRGRMPAWAVYLSAVVDVALLMATIWSFHLKYAQAAAFYLKAPTLLYVFLFIALRALRFDARLVLLTGGAAAVGWALMTGFALGWFDAIHQAGVPTDCLPHEAQPCVVTRNYVTYMAHSRVLVGAEIDKIVAILSVTAVLALAIARARRQLVRAANEGAAARDLSRFFDPAIARRIRGAEMRVAAGEGELRDAAILTCDLRGFTTLAAALDPDDTMKLLQDYQGRMCPPIQAHGGSIDKFLGDGILASFGAVASSPAYAADALRAADAILDTATRWAAERAAAGLPEIRVGLAVSSGRVVFGAVGDGDRLEYTVIGEAVNLAAKLEKHTKQEGVRALVDAATWALALDQGYVPPGPRAALSARAVGGVAAPLDLVRLA